MPRAFGKIREVVIGDMFRSNDGFGPGVAKIIRIDDDEVYLERWNEGAPNKTYVFSLPLWFFNSPSCGWKRVVRSNAA